MESCPEPKPDCPFAQTALCGLTRHHRFWPKSQYKAQVEKRFRNHPDHIDMMPNCDHRELHLTTKPPEKPPITHMARFLIRSSNGRSSTGDSMAK